MHDILHGGVVYLLARWLRSTYSQSTLVPVTTWMDVCYQAGKPSGYVTSHLGRLNLLSSVGMVKWVSTFGLSNNKWRLYHGRRILQRKSYIF